VVRSALILALFATFAAPAAAGAPVWGKIGNIGVGMLQEAVIEQNGLGEQQGCGQGCVDIRYYGKVEVEFKGGRVVSISCAAPGSLAGRGCPAGFALPGGVELGTRVPYRKQWRGFSRYVPATPQSDLFYWRRYVRVGGRRIEVDLVVEKGRVIDITESALRG
jgi:hypothetical protein